MDDAALHAKLKAMILEDQALHIKILHYEVRFLSLYIIDSSIIFGAEITSQSTIQPIHFDTFLNMAADKGIHVRTLKTKMRAFLDKQVRGRRQCPLIHEED